MKPSGIVAIVLLLFFFWPLAFIPCLMEDCFEVRPLLYSMLGPSLQRPHARSEGDTSCGFAQKQQRPVYGYSSGQGQQPVIPVGQPVKGEPMPGESYPKADKPPPI